MDALRPNVTSKSLLIHSSFNLIVLGGFLCKCLKQVSQKSDVRIHYFDAYLLCALLILKRINKAMDNAVRYLPVTKNLVFYTWST